MTSISISIKIDNSSMRKGEVYKDKEKKLVLVSLSNLYSEPNKISVGTSRPLTSLISHYLPTTYFTYYCSD